MCIHCKKAGVFDAATEIKFDGQKAIRQAIEDYRRHTTAVEVLDEISEEFITRLAKDSYNAKTELRNLFSKSPNWNEELQAIVINATRAHKPNYELVEQWMYKIICSLLDGSENAAEKFCDAEEAIKFFICSNDTLKDKYIDKLNKIAPKAYKKGKKLSRIFKAMCDALGVTDNAAGSDFQKFFAKISDELTEKTVEFKLYISINPAHFLTMSNPKKDNRGSTMVSCHSLNSTEYEYNCGCTGYARDKYTFIVFTASDDNNPETLNNRKTSRQIFAYKPNNGVLLQSRIYLTKSGESYGGVDGDTEEGKLYRKLIQCEIASLENAQNLWELENYCENKFGIELQEGVGFGGYADWTYGYMGAKISLRDDHKNNFGKFKIGTYGLCIKCGDEINKGLFCEDCNAKRPRCESCQQYCESTREVCWYDGRKVTVCVSCFRNYYRLCHHCGEYHHIDYITEVADGNFVCVDCLHRRYTQCECCGEYYPSAEIQDTIDSQGEIVYACENCRNSEDCERYQECSCCGARVPYRVTTEVADGNFVCESCLDAYYALCDECGEYHLYRDMFHNVIGRDGERISICENCRENYETCAECDRVIHPDIANYLENDLAVCEHCLQELYEYCEDCNEYHRYDEMNTAIDSNGYEIRICDCCAEDYERCYECGYYVHSEIAVETEDSDGCQILLCPNCAENKEGAVI